MVTKSFTPKLPEVEMLRNTPIVVVPSFLATTRSDFPSLLKSPMAAPEVLLPEVNSDTLAYTALFPPVKVTLNGVVLAAVKPLSVLTTFIGWKVAPAGTVTVNEVALAALTVALVAPK